MVDIENYISRLIDLLLDRFGSRLLDCRAAIFAQRQPTAVTSTLWLS